LIFNNVQRSAVWLAIEKELHLPAHAVEPGDGERGQHKIVGEEYQSLAGFGIDEFDSAQRRFETLARIKDGEHHGLVADQSRGAVYGMRITALRFEVRLGARDEETARIVQPG
jgi:hypothetical protein